VKLHERGQLTAKPCFYASLLCSVSTSSWV